MPGRRDFAEIHGGQWLSRRDPLAFAHGHDESLAIHIDGVNADMNQHFDAVIGFNAEGMAGPGHGFQRATDRC